MTFEELEHSLPNGLHDAELLAVQIDYRTQTTTLDLDIDTSAPTETDVTYRRGRVTFADTQFLVLDSPHTSADFLGPSRVDAGMGQPSTAPCVLPELHQGCFLCWLFVERSNSFIRIAARSVTLEWLS
jgi:hypothetical protein